MKSEGKKTSIKKVLLFLNLILFVTIIALLLNKINVRSLNFELKYGEVPQKFFTFVNDNFIDKQNKKILVIFIFNDLPSISDIETIKKLYTKHKNDVQFRSIFHKKFRSPISLDFPSIFLRGFKTKCNYMGKSFDSNYYILLNEKEVRFVDISIKPMETNFLIEKNLSPGKDYNNYAISKERLKEKLVEELKKEIRIC